MKLDRWGWGGEGAEKRRNSAKKKKKFIISLLSAQKIKIGSTLTSEKITSNG